MSALSPSSLNVRLEQPEDVIRIRQINELAFEGTTEADLVDALREAGGVTLSMVAIAGGEVIGGGMPEEEGSGGEWSTGQVFGGEVVGHVVITPVTVATEHGEFSLLGLGPIAVLPAEQHQGIGTMLIESCLERLRTEGHGAVVVIGEPRYFERFGFIPASRWGMKWEAEVPGENLMALELSPGMLAGVSGVVRYRPEFAEP